MQQIRIRRPRVRREHPWHEVLPPDPRDQDSGRIVIRDTGTGRRAVLELRSVSKIYGQGAAGVRALRDAGLSVEAGSVVAVMYAVFAVYAGGVALFSGLGDDRWWGIWAAGGYATAGALAWSWRSRRGRQAALAAGLAGVLAAPLTWLAIQAPATPDVQVVTRSAALLLHHATPYLPTAQLAHGGWLAYDPYLPVMAIFGLPRALGLPGLAGDPRPWLAAATFLLLAAAFRAAAEPAPLRRAAVATASPVIAFPIALGITDPPVLALTCLALALLTRPARPAAGTWPADRTRAAALVRPARLAAVVLGVACAMKYTAWPALAVLAAMIAARDGARAAARFAAMTAATTLTLAAALAPAALTAPAALIQNTILYPLGLTAARSPAQSPLPGHLLAAIGPAGHLAAITLLITAGVAIAPSLVIRPPADTPAAARRLALGLALMFALSPATRFGYFAYPVGLFGWIALRHQPVGHDRPAGDPVRRRDHAGLSREHHLDQHPVRHIADRNLARAPVR